MKMIVVLVLAIVLCGGLVWGGDCACKAEVNVVSPMLIQYEGMSNLACQMSIWCSGITYCYTGPNLYTCTYQISAWHYHPDFTISHYFTRCRLYRDNGWFPDALLNTGPTFPVPWERATFGSGEHTATSYNAPDYAIVEAEIHCTCTNTEEFVSGELWFNEVE